MKAMIRIWVPHLAQSNGSTAYTCLINAAQPWRAFVPLTARVASGAAGGPAGGCEVALCPRFLLEFVEDLSLLGHLDHPRLAERAAQEVLDQSLNPFPVAGFQPDALVHAEPGVLPTPDVLDDRLGDLPLRQQQPEDLLFPALEKGFGGQLRQRQKCAIGNEHPFADQGMDVRMPTTPSIKP
jgi:hypothetical protein